MKETIVKKAFEQYLTEGYEKVTISNLQKSLGIGRATMYYYFDSKEHLFECVMETYFKCFIEDGFSKIDENTGVPEMIDIYADTFERISLSIADLKNPAITMSSYTGILFYAFSHEASLAVQINDIRVKIHEYWCAAIRNSQKKGEVREDIDVDTIAYTFESVKGVFGEISADEATIRKEIQLFRNSHMELYKLLRK